MHILTLLLLGCPGKDAADADSGSAENTSTTWAGTLGGHALSDGDVAAIWVAAAPGGAFALGPSGQAAEHGVIGVDFDASVLLWVTDVPDPCVALSTYEEYMTAATLAMISSDEEAAADALTAASAAVPAQFGSVAIGLAAEDAAGLFGTWDLAVATSTEGDEGWHVAAHVAQQQVGTPDWDAVYAGAETLERSFVTDVVQSGTATTSGVEDDGRLVVEIAGELDDGPLTIHAVATRCARLEAALAPVYGEPSEVE